MSGHVVGIEYPDAKPEQARQTGKKQEKPKE